MKYKIIAVSVFMLLNIQSAYCLSVGPIAGVVDGDTFKTNQEILPAIFDYYRANGTPNIRVLGIDTPEKGKNAKCDKERELAKKASAFATMLYKTSKTNEVVDLSMDDKYGRVLSDVFFDGVSYSEMAIKKGYARPYNGGKKSSWCD